MRIIHDTPITGAERITELIDSVTEILSRQQEFFDRFSGAACVDANTSKPKSPKYIDMYPPTESWVNPAKMLCSTCIHIDMCYETALTNNEKHGVWGGSSEEERRDVAAAYAEYSSETEQSQRVSLVGFAVQNREIFVAEPDPEGEIFSPKSYENRRYKRKKSKPVVKN